MPAPHIACSSRQDEPVDRQEAERRLRAMRKAVAVGIADIEAGRYLVFDTVDALCEHLSDLADEAIGGTASTEDRT